MGQMNRVKCTSLVTSRQENEQDEIRKMLTYQESVEKKMKFRSFLAGLHLKG